MANLIEKLWNENAGVKDDNQFPEGRAIPCVVDGITQETPDKNKKDNVRVILKIRTIDGTDKDGNQIRGGRLGRITYDLYDIEFTSKKTGQKGVISGEDRLIQMMKDLNKLGFDTEELGFDEIKEEVNDQDSESIYIYVNSKVNANGYTNIYVGYLIPDSILNGLIDSEEEDDDGLRVQEDEDEESEEEVPFEEEDEEEDDEEVLDEEDDDDYEEDDDEEDEEEDDFAPEKGMVVLAKPKRTNKYLEYKVVTCSQRSQTAKLKRIRDDKVFVNVEFDLIREEV